MNILQKAQQIVFERKEEKERMYGSFSEGMKRASAIATAATGKDITAEDMYICMIALKLSRQSYNHKEDNLLDAIAYMAALNNHINESNKNETTK
jgi:DNA-binding protein H-NS